MKPYISIIEAESKSKLKDKIETLSADLSKLLDILDDLRADIEGINDDISKEEELRKKLRSKDKLSDADKKKIQDSLKKEDDLEEEKVKILKDSVPTLEKAKDIFAKYKKAKEQLKPTKKKPKEDDGWD